MTVTLTRIVVIVGLLIAGMGTAARTAGAAEPEASRVATKKVLAAYPLIARKLHLDGKVKLSVVVTHDGKVKSVDVIGGAPAFALEATRAAKQWVFAPAAKESIETLVFDFKSPE